MKDLESTGRGNDAAALTAAMLERYYKEVSSHDAEVIEKEFLLDMERNARNQATGHNGSRGDAPDLSFRST